MAEEEKKLVPPVSEGDILESQEVISSGKKNDGVVKYQGYIIFVDSCTKGDIIDVRVEKVLPKFGVGKRV